MIFYRSANFLIIINYYQLLLFIHNLAVANLVNFFYDDLNLKQSNRKSSRS